MIRLSPIKEGTPTISSQGRKDVLAMSSRDSKVSSASGAPVTPNTARAREAAAAEAAAAGGSAGPQVAETTAERFRRGVLRAWLHSRAIGVVVLGAILTLLAAANTGHVEIHWLIGSSRVSLIWLLLVTAVIAWLLGLIAGSRFQRLTRPPGRQRPDNA